MTLVATLSARRVGFSSFTLFDAPDETRVFSRSRACPHARTPSCEDFEAMDDRPTRVTIGRPVRAPVRKRKQKERIDGSPHSKPPVVDAPKVTPRNRRLGAQRAPAAIGFLAPSSCTLSPHLWASSALELFARSSDGLRPLARRLGSTSPLQGRRSEKKQPDWRNVRSAQFRSRTVR